jgi:hypothetical protein
MIGSMPHEMRLLKYINDNNDQKFINLLPILPTDQNFINYGYCFDPSSYGQYLGGAAPEKALYIGAKIIEGKIKVEFKNKKPIIITNNQQEYKIFNLSYFLF